MSANRKRLAAVGGLRPGPARAVARPRRQLHAPDAEMALRNARDVYTRRQEGVSIWVVPAAADHRVQPGREGRVLRPGRRQDLPAPDLLRRARGRRAPVTDDAAHVPQSRLRRCGLGDDALISAQRLGEWISRAPQLEEDSRWQHRARPARPGPRAAHLRRRARGRRPRRGRPGLPPRRARVPQRPARRAAQQRLRRHHGQAAGLRDLPVPSCTPPCSARTDETLAASRGQGRQGGRLPPSTTPRHVDRCASATAPTSRTGGCRRRSTRSGPTSTSSSSPTSTPALVDAGHRRRPGDAADRRARRGSTAVLAEATLTVPEVPPRVTGGRARRAHRARGLPARRDAGAARAHPGARGDAGRRRADAAAWDASPPTVPDPEMPVLTIEDLGILRDVDRRRPGHGSHVTITPTYSGCPAMDAIRADVVDALDRGGLPPTSTSSSCCRRPGPPTG